MAGKPHPNPGTLHHIEIYVSDLECSVAFWEWLLVGEFGYERFQQWDHGISFKQDDTYLVFVQTDPAFLDIDYHRKRTGLNHLAFWAESRNRVDELTEKLRVRDVHILYEDTHPYAGGPDHYAVFCEDPDGIKVEIVARE